MSWFWPDKKEKQTWMASDYMGFYLCIVVFIILIVSGSIMWIGEIDSTGIGRGSYSRREAATITGPGVIGIACVLLLFMLMVRIIDTKGRRRRIKEYELEQVGLLREESGKDEIRQADVTHTEAEMEWTEYEDLSGRDKEVNRKA